MRFGPSMACSCTASCWAYCKIWAMWAALAEACIAVASCMLMAVSIRLAALCFTLQATWGRSLACSCITSCARPAVSFGAMHSVCCTSGCDIQTASRVACLRLVLQSPGLRLLCPPV